MKSVVIGAHLRRDDVEPLATALRCGDLWLSGVDVADDQPLGDRELLLRVANTRAQLLDRATFIAIRYGFSVRDASEAAAKCASHLSRWRRLLVEHRESVEMTLKIAAASPTQDWLAQSLIATSASAFPPIDSRAWSATR